VPVPSIFFIGENGRPLEIVVKISSPSDLVSKIDSILEKIKLQVKHSAADVVNAEKKAHSSSNNQEINKVQDTTSTNSETLGQTSASLPANNVANNSAPATEAVPSAEITKEVSITFSMCA
jgi:hypothetical protein